MSTGDDPPASPPSATASRSERRRAAAAAQARRRRRRLLIGGAIVVVLAAALAIVLIVTSDDDAPRDVSSAPPSTAATSTTSSAPTTSGAPPTTAVPRSEDPLVAAVQQYDGRYTGTWETAKNGATGTVSMELRVDPATGTIQIDADFDGDLFGNETARARHLSGVIPLTTATAPAPVATEAFGEVIGHVDATSGGVVLEANSVPDEGVDTFTLVGRIRADGTGLDVTFVVEYPDGSAADGSVTIGCDPGGNRPSEVPTLCAPA